MNAATIIESSGKTFEHREEPGIFSCLFEHEIKATKANFTWKGPKITKEQWDEMLAFFRWTYDVHKSEAQVRLFVHPELGWKIWAFPQNGGTSMTTKEVDNEDSKLQRAAIPEGYVPFGTVHHHCNIGAFQSGTDTHDETSVDGLHITIGNLGDELFSMHCRLYLKKNKFEPNMCSFWDVGEEAREKCDWLADLKYNTDEVLNREARLQMCIPAANEIAFNELWRTNYILPAPPVGFTQGPWCWYCQKHTKDHTPDQCPDKDKGGNGKKGRRRRKHLVEDTVRGSASGTTDWWDEKTWDDLMQLAKDHKLTDLEVAEILNYLGGPEAGSFIAELIELASDNYKTMAAMYELAQKKWADPAAVTETAEEKIAEDAKREAAAKTEEEIVEIYRGGLNVD